MTDANAHAAAVPLKTRPAQADTSVRECRSEDFDAVATLFQRILRHGEQCNLAALASYLRDLFRGHPWRDPRLPSLVSVRADGAVNGFLGVLPVRMTFRSEPLSAALSSSLMVDNPKQDPLAGARLLTAFLHGPQDLSLTETANGLRIWKSLGARVAAQYSMDWIRILRPSEAALVLCERSVSLLHPLHGAARLIDRILSTADGLPFRLTGTDPGIGVGDLDTDALIELLQSFAVKYELKPAWTQGDLRWFLMHAGHKESHGELTSRSVVGAKGMPIGCYLYYGRRGGIALVLEIMTRAPQHADVVVRRLLADAYESGCVAVRGRTQPDLIEALLRSGCVFKRGSWVTMCSRRPELLAAIRDGKAWVTGLAGESWTRLIQGQFV